MFYRKSKYFFTGLFLLALAYSQSARAGGNVSGGGDKYVLDFMRVHHQVVGWLQENGSFIRPAFNSEIMNAFLLAANPKEMDSKLHVYDITRKEPDGSYVEVDAFYDADKNWTTVSQSRRNLDPASDYQKWYGDTHETLRKLSHENPELLKRYPTLSDDNYEVTSQIEAGALDALSSSKSKAKNIQKDAVRLSCSDAKEVATLAGTALMGMSENLSKFKGWALQSSSGTLGSNDRSYLDTERTQLVEEMDRIALTTEFTDSYQKFMQPLLYDINLVVPVKSEIDNKTHAKYFKIPSARVETLGHLAQEIFPLTQSQPPYKSGYLFIGETAINVPNDEQISDYFGNFSSIAVARQINELSEQTEVSADVLPTRVMGINPQFVELHGSPLCEGLEINGIKISSCNFGGTNAFISFLNSYAAEDGVLAMFEPGSNSHIVLVANDGRNITIKVTTDSEKELFSGLGLSLNKPKTFFGSLRLRSGDEFEIKADSRAIFGFVGKHTVHFDGRSLANANLRTQSGAIDAVNLIRSAERDLDLKIMQIDEILRYCH